MPKDGSSTARGSSTSRGDKSARAPSANKMRPPAAPGAPASGSQTARGDGKGKDAKPKPQASPLGGAAAPSAAPAKSSETKGDAKTDAKASAEAKPTTPASAGSRGTPTTPATPATPATPGQAVQRKKGDAKGKSEFKTFTSGQTAIVEFVSADDHDEALGGDEASSPPKKAMGNTWTATKWLEEVENLEGCLAEALCCDEEGCELADLEALAMVRSCDTRDELLERLRIGGALEKLTDAIWPKLEVLKAGPATASELADQWKGEGAGGLLYGGLPAFFNGLESRIGSPDPKVFKDMMGDHCSRTDSQVHGWVCVCACVHACVRACVRAYVRVCMCVCVRRALMPCWHRGIALIATAQRRSRPARAPAPAPAPTRRCHSARRCAHGSCSNASAALPRRRALVQIGAASVLVHVGCVPGPMAAGCGASLARAQVEFCTGNYSVKTTSEVEWKFVVEPESSIRWPVEERLAGSEESRGHMRKLLTPEQLKRRMDEQNRNLEAIGADQLQYFEVVGGRMYTGVRLRARRSKVGRMDQAGGAAA